MPAALTPEEKRLKSEAKRKAVQKAPATVKPLETASPLAEVVRTTTQRGSRSRRNSFNGTEGKLRIAHEIEGYHLHIFNDTPGRIDEALSVGYEFVTPDEVGGVAVNTVSRNNDLGDKVRFLVGVDGSNQPQYAYLMKQRLEFYEEDQQEIQAKVNKTDAAIRRGQLTKEGYSTDGFYVPKGGIQIKQ